MRDVDRQELMNRECSHSNMRKPKFSFANNCSDSDCQIELSSIFKKPTLLQKIESRIPRKIKLLFCTHWVMREKLMLVLQIHYKVRVKVHVLHTFKLYNR